MKSVVRSQRSVASGQELETSTLCVSRFTLYAAPGFPLAHFQKGAFR